MRDFASELAGERCWDRHTQAIYEQRGEPIDDCILQNRAELLELCRFIEKHDLRSYLEVGAWTGRLALALQRLFGFEQLAVCDDGFAERFGLSLHLPPGARFFRGNSGSREYREFLGALGPVDLIFIDADHRLTSVRRDFELHRAHPHRFLALHDISGANRHTQGVGQFWRQLSAGHKREILLPHPEAGLDVPDMGIGLWSAEERP